MPRCKLLVLFGLLRLLQPHRSALTTHTENGWLSSLSHSLIHSLTHSLTYSTTLQFPQTSLCPWSAVEWKTRPPLSPQSTPCTRHQKLCRGNVHSTWRLPTSPTTAAGKLSLTALLAYSLTCHHLTALVAVLTSTWVTHTSTSSQTVIKLLM
jgi:hypothetical protein